MREIASGLYLESRYRSGNLGLIITTRGAVLIDTPMIPAEAADWLREVNQLCQTGIAYVISTDYQGPRVLGNYFFSAPIIMHEEGWNELRTHGENILQRYINMYKKRDPDVATRLADVEIVLPQVTIVDQLTIYKGAREIQIWHMPGHSPASLGVYIPDSGVLFAGDVVVSEQHPQLANATSQEWIATLERIQAMDVKMIIPGRGAACTKAAIPPLIEYIQEMRNRVSDFYKQGSSRRDTVDKVRNEMLERFPVADGRKDVIARQIRSSVERVYEEIRKGL